MPVYVAHAIPFAEGAVIALAASGFGRWRSRRPQDRYIRLLWVGGILAAIVAGIDAWNWLPGWPHEYPLSPWGGVPGLPPPPLPTPLNVGVLFQGFLLPPWWLYLGPGHVAPDWASGPSMWLPQAYVAAAVAGGLCLAYLAGARQLARLRRVVIPAATWGGTLLLLRTPAIIYAVWLRMHHLVCSGPGCPPFPGLHAQPFVAHLAPLLIVPQLVLVLTALPVLALMSARWAQPPSGHPAGDGDASPAPGATLRPSDPRGPGSFSARRLRDLGAACAERPHPLGDPLPR